MTLGRALTEDSKKVFDLQNRPLVRGHFPVRNLTRQDHEILYSQRPIDHPSLGWSIENDNTIDDYPRSYYQITEITDKAWLDKLEKDYVSVA